MSTDKNNNSAARTKDIPLFESLDSNSANMFITESVNESEEGKKLFLQGIFMESNRNQNNRVYPVQILSSAVEMANDTIQKFGGIFGELDHPNTLDINMDRISHVIREMKMDGDRVVGKIELLDTPMGLIAQTLAKSGVKYGVSSRGKGSLDYNNTVKTFKFVTVDLVATPSAYNAYPDTLYESLQHFDGAEQLEYLAKMVKHDQDAQKYFQKEIKRFIQEVIVK